MFACKTKSVDDSDDELAKLNVSQVVILTSKSLDNLVTTCQLYKTEDNQSLHLLINVREAFFDTNVGSRPNLARMCG